MKRVPKKTEWTPKFVLVKLVKPKGHNKKHASRNSSNKKNYNYKDIDGKTSNIFQ